MRRLMMLATAAALSLSACQMSFGADRGNTVQRGYSVSDFTKLAVAGPYEVKVVSGATPSVSASGSEQALDRLRVEVRGDTLDIGTVKRSGFSFGWSERGKVIVTVTVPALQAATIAGSGGVAIDRIAGPRFKGSVAGSGDLHLRQVEVQALDVSIAGSGDVRAAGKAGELRMSIAGSGDIDTSRLVAERADLAVVGSGAINGHATQSAAVSIRGSGDVTLTGGAKCTVSKTGSGDVRCS